MPRFFRNIAALPLALFASLALAADDASAIDPRLTNVAHALPILAGVALAINTRMGAARLLSQGVSGRAILAVRGALVLALLSSTLWWH
jgi:hypothetical protein